MTEPTIVNKPKTDEEKWNKPCDNYCVECETACNDDDFIEHATHKKFRTDYTDLEWKAHQTAFSTTIDTDAAIREGKLTKKTLEESKTIEADTLAALEAAAIEEI